ncbi:hypothetical protein Tco_1156061 [Tanacetum coccineum]
MHMRAPFVLAFKDLPHLTMKENSTPTTLLEENYDSGHARRTRVAYEANAGLHPRIRGFWHNRRLRFCLRSSSTTSVLIHSSGSQSQARSPKFPQSHKAASAEYSAWTTTDTRIKPSITTIPDDLYMDDETTADEQAFLVVMR